MPFFDAKVNVMNEQQGRKEAAERFVSLMEAARAAGDPEPTAFMLATSADGRVSARALLLKSVDEQGFVFYTHNDSAKGKQMAANPQVAMTFLWKTLDLQVQVRIEGKVAFVSDAEADAYFASRPRDSQLGAWASEQSQAMPDADALTRRMDEMRAQFDGQDVPRPKEWCGYRLVPDLIEFWHGKPYRLHDRFVYTFNDGDTSQAQLYP